MAKYTEIYDLGLNKKTPFPMDLPEILKVTVVIRLSSAQYIPTVRRSLDGVLQSLDVNQKGNVITVSGYPFAENFGANDVLAHVRRYDRGAQRV